MSIQRIRTQRLPDGRLEGSVCWKFEQHLEDKCPFDAGPYAESLVYVADLATQEARLDSRLATVALEYIAQDQTKPGSGGVVVELPDKELGK